MPVRATLWLLILAVLLGLAAHAPARHAAFQFDDFPAVVENPALQTPFRLGDPFRPRPPADYSAGLFRPSASASAAGGSTRQTIASRAEGSMRGTCPSNSQRAPRLRLGPRARGGPAGAERRP